MTGPPGQPLRAGASLGVSFAALHDGPGRPMHWEAAIFLAAQLRNASALLMIGSDVGVPPRPRLYTRAKARSSRVS